MYSLPSSHAVTGDLDIGEVARAAEFCCSDGVIVTGRSTGSPADTDELVCVREAVRLPLLVGSGVTTNNLEQYMTKVDGMIVGSEFKVGGQWCNDIDIDRIRRLIAKKEELNDQ